MDKTLGIIIIVIVVVAVIAGVWVYSTTPTTNENSNISTTNTNTAITTNTNSANTNSDTTNINSANANTTSSSVKEFTIVENEFSFDVPTITVKKGDTVKVTLKNEGKFGHDLKIDEFNFAITKVLAGQQGSGEFIADKAGTFKYYCSVAGTKVHRDEGMEGTLTVTE